MIYPQENNVLLFLSLRHMWWKIHWRLGIWREISKILGKSHTWSVGSYHDSCSMSARGLAQKCILSHASEISPNEACRGSGLWMVMATAWLLSLEELLYQEMFFCAHYGLGSWDSAQTLLYRSHCPEGETNRQNSSWYRIGGYSSGS